ncbi:MAG: hypothetical protein H0X31_21785 [Nostocaceae cyanobacterium]|nr:hypothetical protein [Nostocaceae cyanobacterium]
MPKLTKRKRERRSVHPGGQPGHVGKTRKGFGRVDRYEISVPCECENCGSTEFSEIIGYNKQQVACLAAKPYLLLWNINKPNVNVLNVEQWSAGHKPQA